MTRKSTGNGRKFEKIVMDYVREEGLEYTDQPETWPENVSATIRPDGRVDLPTGPLWIFAQQDFWNGGQQTNRLDHAASMDKYAWNPGEVFYVVRKPGAVKPGVKRITETRTRKETVYNDLVSRGVVGTLDQLMERINGSLS